MHNLNEHLTELGWRITCLSLRVVEDDIARVADLAFQRGLVIAAAKVLADRSQPEVARERAFSIVSGALTRTSPARADIPAA